MDKYNDLMAMLLEVIYNDTSTEPDFGFMQEMILRKAEKRGLVAPENGSYYLTTKGDNLIKRYLGEKE